MLRISYCPLLGNAFTNYGSEITIYHDKSEPFSRKDSLVAGFLGAMCVLAWGGVTFASAASETRENRYLQRLYLL